MNIFSKNLLIYIMLFGALGFISLQYITNKSPQALVSSIYQKIAITSGGDPVQPTDEFSHLNAGIYEKLKIADDRIVRLNKSDLARVLGVHNVIDPTGDTYRVVTESKRDGIAYKMCFFKGYDALDIPFYEMFPQGFDEGKAYPSIVLFSGHGNMDEAAFDSSSYQRGLGIELAKKGYVVYVMENRGMGKLSHLGNHKRIDAVARLVGGSWYGEITTDALYLIELVKDRSYTGKLGVAGVSTGGALSLFTSALDERISATYVQGYLGSYQTTFGSRANHCECNNISGILNEFDMHDIASSLFPRSAMYVNGDVDYFFSEDAQVAFNKVQDRYQKGGKSEMVEFVVPKQTNHSMSVSLAIDYFHRTLK